MCRPMPESLRVLRDNLHDQVKERLSAKARFARPTSCDVLFYYRALDSKTGRHKDVFTSAELDQYYRHGTNPFDKNQYAQDKGTEVLIYSMGNAEMVMGLSFPRDKGDANDRTRYEQPPELRIPLQPGTLLVYSCLDDFFFCHEVAFAGQVASPGPTLGAGYRVALVFRWLNKSAERLYYIGPEHHGRHVLGG